MGSKLFVGNLSATTGEAELRDAFAACGTITEVHIASDRYTGRPRGFAFVTFATEAEAQAAIPKLNGAVVDGQAITVNEARAPGTTTTPTGRTFSSPNRKAGAFHDRRNWRR
jgi:RNA recognition motif-containing protein